MLQNTKKGFTLIELLMGIVVIGIISTIAMRMIYNMVSYRSKQFAIEDTSDSFRNFISTFSNEVRSAKMLNVSASGEAVEIIFIDDSCVTYSYSSTDKVIQRSGGSSSPCVANPSAILPKEKFRINKMVFSPIGNDQRYINISIPKSISGVFEDSVYYDKLGERPFQFNTTISKRI